jgi:heterodisulfide reductase subunit A
MEKKGIRPERLQLEWISAAEGQKFALVMREVEKLRLQVTPEEIAETVRILKEEEKKEAAKAAKREAAKKKKEAPIPV